jgi:spoIIIJ-associated protein
MEEKNLQLIKETVEELLTKGGFAVQTEVSVTMEDGEENVICNVTTGEDSNFLIGQYGTNLQALQHLIRLIVRKKTDDKIKFVLDVNSYRQEKNQAVIEMAKNAAEEALRDGRPVMLRPMSAYERRLIHMELSQNTAVLTESVGEGDARKVVVKPANSI